ncbi:hypothetical protein BASA81_006136 [Batrachochytrium salamandrivorans]|nr:hypothetical protein BASA81_006136 [Batrachochytrium salamandrivorans]
MGVCESRARLPTADRGNSNGGGGDVHASVQSKLLKRLPSARRSNQSADPETATGSELQSRASLLTSRDERRSNGSDVVRPINQPSNRRTSLKSRASLTSVGSIPENETVKPRPLSVKAINRLQKAYSFKKPAAAVPDEKIDALYLLFEDEEMDFDLAMSQEVIRKKTRRFTKDSAGSSTHNTAMTEDSENGGSLVLAAAAMDDEQTARKTIAKVLLKYDDSVSPVPAKVQRSASVKAVKRPGRSFFKSRSKSYVATEALEAQDPIEMTESMINLLDCIANLDTRNQLVHRLMGLEGGLSVLVRFISAVEQYEASAANPGEQKRMGEKIVAIFLEDEQGRFAITVKDDTRKHLVVDGFLIFLPYAKLEVLHELAQNEQVVDMVGEGGVVFKPAPATPPPAQ